MHYLTRGENTMEHLVLML